MARFLSERRNVVKKWEYMCQRLPHDQPDIEKGLDKLGKNGWEMTGCGTIGTGFDTSKVLLLFFKREIPEPPAPTTPKPSSATNLVGNVTDLGDCTER
jgi:hypothetical protein